MSNKIRTYIKNVDDTDPLRLELNSTWIGAHPAYEVIGPPKSIEISKYFEPATETSIDHFYQKRQKIRVEKLAAFDANQGGIAVLDPFGNPIINTLSSTPQSFTEFVTSSFTPYFNTHSSPAHSVNETVFETVAPNVTKDFSPTKDAAIAINEVKEEFLINFLEKNYEDAIAPESVSELSLPNFYHTAELNGGAVEDSYFSQYQDKIPSPDPQYENIMISMDNFKDLQLLNGLDASFPLEIKISPYNPIIYRKTGFHDALDNSNLDLTLIDLMSRQGVYGEGQHVGGASLDSRNYKMIEISETEQSSQVDLKSLDLLHWARNVSAIIDSLLDPNQGNVSNKIYIGPDNPSIDIAKGTSGFLSVILSSATFLNKVATMIENNLRSFEEINTGKKSYSEIVFYKVEKYTSPDAPTPIQNIWIPNLEQVDPIEYVDTQVKYNKQYTYKILAYSAIIGTSYYYDTSTLETTFPIAKAYEPCVILADTAGPSVPEHIHKIENWKIVGNHEDAHGDDQINNHPHPDLDPIVLAGGYDWVKGFTETVEGFGIFDTDVLFDGGKAGDHHHKFKVDSSGNGVTLCGEPITETKITPADPSQEYFEIDVITAPKVELIETELFTFAGTILDNPPIPPDIKFISYNGVDNQITISMHAQVGEFEGMPVILDPEESDYLNSLMLTRGTPPDSIITYRTDDETSAFEIYRTEELPTSYDDFSNSSKTTVSTLQKNSSNTIYSWDKCYKDKITPNKEYYYMVRSIDVHGHKSYPSPVYRIQMVNNSGAIYPLVDVIEMKSPSKPKMKTKKFKKFLQLTPAMAQTSIDYVGSGLIGSTGLVVNSAPPTAENITLGTVAPKLFGDEKSGQTFKIRLISKHTGKKLDLNVTFKVKNEL
jgi:hypothetical protein